MCFGLISTETQTILPTNTWQNASEIKLLLLDIVHADVNTADLHGGDLSSMHAEKDRMIEFSVQISVITCALEAAEDMQR